MRNKAWQCEVCGYVHREAEPPEECPICGSGKSDFSLFEEAVGKEKMEAPKAWRCLNCYYVHHDDNPPEKCPVCDADKDRFEPFEEKTENESSELVFDGNLIVVGAGIAGVSAVEAFREKQKNGTVILISKEDKLPYYRLNLTRCLAKEVGYDTLPIHPRDWYDENSVDLRLGCEVAEIDSNEKKIVLNDGETLSYAKLILAMGAHPFIPPIHGANKEGVTALRTVSQTRLLQDSIRPGMKCVCVGGGVLGLEIAGALARYDVEVTLLEAHEWLMPRQLNRKAAEVLWRNVKNLGIEVLFQARTKEIRGDERASEILLEDDRVVQCDQAIICTGVRCNSFLARRAGLEVNQGIVVDNFLNTSADGILAVGDVAEHRGVLYGNWSAAQFQGSTAGMNAAGVRAEFGGLPRSNTLKVLGLDLVSIGKFEPEDGSYKVVERAGDGKYLRFVFRDTHLVGAVLVGDASISAQLKKAIQEKRDFSAELARNVSAQAFFDLCC